MPVLAVVLEAGPLSGAHDRQERHSHDLRYRYDGRDVVLRAAELAPFLVYETATLRQLAASSSLPPLTALVISRLADLQQLGIVPELTGSLAVPLLAASQSQEMPLP